MAIQKKAKIRFYFAEDAQRSWNKIKLADSLPSLIKPQEFADHYSKNWATKPQELNLDEYNLFTEHEENNLSMSCSNFIRQITNKKRIIEMIKHKGKLSAPGLDKITYPIFKYLPEESADLFINITKMLIHTRNCLISWKERKVVMLPKPVSNEKEKSKSENWRPITIPNAMYRITVGIIARWFQDLHKERTDDAKKRYCS
jgi:hypothetical protein